MLEGFILCLIATFAGWLSYRDKQYLRYTRWLYRRKEPATKENSFVYKKRRFDKEAFINGESTYIRSLKEEDQTAGYEKLKGNNKLKNKYPEYYSSIMSAYERVINEKKATKDGFLSVSEQIMEYRKIYNPRDPSKEDFLLCDRIFECCQDRLSVMSEDDFSKLRETADGNIKIMALKIIDATCDGVKATVLGNAVCEEHKIWAAGTAAGIDKIKIFYGNRLVDIVMDIALEAPTDQQDVEEPQDDDYPDGFEDVDLSEDEIKDTLARKKKNHSSLVPLLVFFIVMLSIAAILLPIGTYAIGSESGYTKGYTTGHNDGEKKGKEEGYNEGYSDGQNDVDITEYYQDGYDDGYQQGYSNAYDVGWYDAIDGYGYLGNYGDGY